VGDSTSCARFGFFARSYSHHAIVDHNVKKRRGLRLRPHKNLLDELSFS
jgi:hypothetical protein